MHSGSVAGYSVVTGGFYGLLKGLSRKLQRARAVRTIISNMQPCTRFTYHGAQRRGLQVEYPIKPHFVPLCPKNVSICRAVENYESSAVTQRDLPKAKTMRG